VWRQLADTYLLGTVAPELCYSDCSVFGRVTALCSGASSGLTYADWRQFMLHLTPRLDVYRSGRPWRELPENFEQSRRDPRMKAPDWVFADSARPGRV